MFPKPAAPDRATLIRLAIAVFAIAFAVLAWRISADTVAASYVDPVDRIRAQDESLFVNSALGMERQGDWLTPKFMGRMFLFKPPMLVWLSVLSIKVFGVSLFSLRLASLLAGSLGVACAFVWCARAASLSSGLLASGLLLLSPFWQTVSRLCITDVCAASFAVCALLFLACDPLLEKRLTPVGFGVASAASVLSKSVAGALPFVVLAVYFVLSERRRRPRIGRVAVAACSAALTTLPWYIYQLIVHPRWFWADYVEWQLLGIGVHANTGYFARSAVFYIKRVAEMDPVLIVAAVVGLIGAVQFSKLRSSPPALLAFCAVLVNVAALYAFQVRHLPYLALLLPSLCIFAVLCSPSLLRRPRVAVSCLVLLLSVKAIGAWPVRPSAPVLDAASALRWYAGLHRTSELLFVNPDDEFFSATIPLAKVRYCMLDPDGAVMRAVPHYPPLGIILTADQFLQLPRLMPQFANALRTWGLDSTEPVGTVVTIARREQLGEIVHARPDLDLLIPPDWEAAIREIQPAQQIVRYSPTRIFLLSRTDSEHPKPSSPVRVPW
jgi:4-amino-4-deoxy-L-arabinose transferase-like glycosyltransferase